VNDFIAHWGEHVRDRLDIYSLPHDFRLSVVVPVYNESATVQAMIARLLATGLPLEIVFVDDGSEDGSGENLRNLVNLLNENAGGFVGSNAKEGVPDPSAPPTPVLNQDSESDPLGAPSTASDVGPGDEKVGSTLQCGAPRSVSAVLLQHEKNRGKGAAIRTGVQAATGDVIVIQDADLEYEPKDLRALLRPIVDEECDVVYGTRYGSPDRHVSPWWHQTVNRLLTTLASMTIGPRLTDVETCYKMAPRATFQRAAEACHENRFGIEIEITARFARLRARFAEKPICYRHRWYSEGKKIGWKDGVSALRCIFWYGLLRR